MAHRCPTASVKVAANLPYEIGKLFFYER